MTLRLKRHVRAGRMNASQLATFLATVHSRSWREKAMRVVRARKMPWRSRVSADGLTFRGIPLWPSQRKWIANRVTSFIKQTIRAVKAPRQEAGGFTPESVAQALGLVSGSRRRAADRFANRRR